ncbi:hypothetical protein [Streptomyces sp. NPDC056517]|uniref:hypothetical protein n=1 Tax=unclassified Streptomyces TaxID=2593676 RepID=UPI003677D482
MIEHGGGQLDPFYGRSPPRWLTRADATYTFDLAVNIATDAPCNVTNTATVQWSNVPLRDSASDPTVITGNGCNGGSGGGISILPLNRSAGNTRRLCPSADR